MLTASASFKGFGHAMLDLCFEFEMDKYDFLCLLRVSCGLRFQFYYFRVHLHVCIYMCVCVCRQPPAAIFIPYAHARKQPSYSPGNIFVTSIVELKRVYVS